MALYTVRTPYLLKALYHDLEWQIPHSDRGVFLTFDDGPEPEVTPQVLAMLREKNAKATFFCIGHNVSKYPEIYQQILAEGHAVGNHTYNHLNGWKTKNEDYLSNVEACANWVQSKLFRPPYGKISRKQAQLLKTNYRIIMWSLLAADFDSKVSKEQCFENVKQHAKSGSIIVMHDSRKAKEKVLFALPKILEYFEQENFRCLPIQ